MKEGRVKTPKPEPEAKPQPLELIVRFNNGRSVGWRWRKTRLLLDVLWQAIRRRSMESQMFGFGTPSVERNKDQALVGIWQTPDFIEIGGKRMKAVFKSEPVKTKGRRKR